MSFLTLRDRRHTIGETALRTTHIVDAYSRRPLCGKVFIVFADDVGERDIAL